MQVYHATNRESGLEIQRTKHMRPGEAGLFGAAIYFANTPAIARHKAARDGGAGAMMIVAEVDFGRALVLEGAHNNLTLADVRASGANSVKGRSAGDKNWEFVVYDGRCIQVLDCKAIPEEPRRDPTPQPPQRNPTPPPPPRDPSPPKKAKKVVKAGLAAAGVGMAVAGCSVA
jgi:hypothetical protein